MKIFYGLKNGALLQRDEKNVCKCFFKAKVKGEINSSLGTVLRNGDGRYALTGIPVGGPYTFTLSDEENAVELKDIYVGDLWLLGGQSNMEGAGKMRAAQLAYDANPVQEIRAYYMNESWDVAKSQLHQLWESIDECVSEFYKKNRRESPWKTEYPEVQNDGVGPGLYFALEMQKRKGVPQGVVPCGIGGANLVQWDPDGTANYYASAKRRFHECGGNVKGIFWYQGEAEAGEVGCKNFVFNMKTMVAGMRRDFHNPKLPFVQVQIHKYVAAPQEADAYWMKIRELQRTLHQEIDCLATVYTNNCDLDDRLHLSSEAQADVGKRAAEAMDILTGGKGVPSPTFDGFEIVTDDYVPFQVNLKVHFKNVVGKLKTLDAPFGFVMMEKENEPMREIARVFLEGNVARIKGAFTPDKIENYYLCYGWGNTYYCNITDEAGRPIPSFGPLKIKDYLKR